MTTILDSDLGVYAATGGFVLLVFLVAIGVVIVSPTLALTPMTLIGFAVGFLISMGVYYVAYGVYRYVELDEQPYGEHDRDS
jgi:uncharacterized membrane protein